MWVCGQHHALTAVPPEKARCPLHRRLGGPQGRLDGYGNLPLSLPTPSIPLTDRQARSESLYRLSSPGPRAVQWSQKVDHISNQNTFVFHLCACHFLGNITLNFSAFVGLFRACRRGET
jgi:hypothetical protein